MDERFGRPVDFDLDDMLTLDAVAEAIGARPHLLARLIRLGVLETVITESEELFLPSHAVIRLRRMARLRRDLGVNFAGAAVILDLVERIEGLSREVSVLRREFKDESF